MSLLLALLAATAPVVATEDRVTTAVKALPTTLAGMPQHWDHWSPPNLPLVGYGNISGQSVVVAIDAVDAPHGYTTVRNLARAPVERAVVHKVLFEGTFEPTAKPGANSFFGEYVTGKGVKQVWVVEHDGLRTTVSATILNIDDRQRIYDAVMRELFGGASNIQAKN